MKKTLLSALAVFMLLATSRSILAQTNPAGGEKVVAIISIAPYNKLLKDISYVTTLAGRPELAGLIKTYSEKKLNSLEGLDKTKPMGAVVRMGSGEPSVVIFIPVTSLKKLLDSVSGEIDQEAKDEGNGFYSLKGNDGKTMYITSQGGWAFAAQNRDLLKDLHSDPSELLGSLPKQYDVAFRLKVPNIPKKIRQQALNTIKEGAEGVAPAGGNPDQARAIASVIKNIETFFNEADFITVGWNINRKSKTTYLDASVTALPKTSLAKQFKQLGEATSNFTGFMLPEAAVSLSFSSTIAKNDVAEAVAQVEKLRSTALKQLDKDNSIPNARTKKIVKEVLGDIMDVVLKTIQEQKADFGAAAILKPKAPTFVIGGRVADGNALKQALKKFVTVAENDPNFPGIKWDTDKKNGISFHTMLLPVKEPDAQKIFGKTMDVVLGTGKQSVYLAFGKESLEVLKKVIAKSQREAGKSVPSTRISLSVSSIIQFAASVNDDFILTMVAMQASKIGKKDHVNLSIFGIENGARFRLEVEEGLIKLAGQMAALLGEQAAAAPPVELK